MNLRVAANHLVELIEISRNRILRNHKSVRSEIRNLSLPVVVKPLDNRDYRNDRGYPYNDAETRQKRAQLVCAQRIYRYASIVEESRMPVALLFCRAHSSISRWGRSRR